MKKSTEIPHSVELEMEVLAKLFINNDEIDTVSELISARYFYIPIHSRIYEIMMQLYSRGLPASLSTVKGYISREFTDIDVSQYVKELIELASPFSGIEKLCFALRELYLKRELIKLSERSISNCYDDELKLTASVCIEKMESELFNVAINSGEQRTLQHLSEVTRKNMKNLDAAIDSGRAISGTTTGFYDMDHLTGGLHPSDLMIIAARPSMGKTAFALKIAYNVAKHYYDEKINKAVAFFSLEMSAEQLGARLISMTTGIDGHRLRNGMIDKRKELPQINEKIQEINALPILIDDTAALTIASIKAKARRIKRTHNVGLIVVDYLQLARASNINSNTNRVQEIGEISQGLKAIAKELSIPVIALSQLSRAVESRDDRRPMLQDLRDSGNIEQDADIVCFIYRESYYLSRAIEQNDGLSPAERGELVNKRNMVGNIAEILIAKQRNGPIGTFSTIFEGSTTNFLNMERKD
ncbi:Replicative DNA helicase [Candidatus Fokinia solitaria]|uniref:Replicative DNA helicase n=1 Tax=Candidatus Fokinia solitaria TaxID=1802984 RepID=A0A2U8BRZ2_9RICK|nr:replicative DNA helicase [Candidatus Fokinia solitaria]AWD33126.1 Replicative DNA helicase [Candidatus Fokinia solitaria]